MAGAASRFVKMTKGLISSPIHSNGRKGGKKLIDNDIL